MHIHKGVVCTFTRSYTLVYTTHTHTQVHTASVGQGSRRHSHECPQGSSVRALSLSPACAVLAGSFLLSLEITGTSLQPSFKYTQRRLPPRVSVLVTPYHISQEAHCVAQDTGAWQASFPRSLRCRGHERVSPGSEGRSIVTAFRDLHPDWNAGEWSGYVLRIRSCGTAPIQLGVREGKDTAQAHRRLWRQWLASWLLLQFACLQP